MNWRSNKPVWQIEKPRLTAWFFHAPCENASKKAPPVAAAADEMLAKSSLDARRLVP